MTDRDAPTLPIRTVAAETGVNAITLRAWERRYGLVRPQRTESGHRLYSQADVERIHRVLELLDQGVSVGQVKQLLDGPAQPPVAGVVAVQPANTSWDAMLDRMQEAITAFDERRLTAIYSEALAAYPIELVTRRLIIPALQRVGDRWAAGTGSVAEEHFLQVFVRDKLGARIHHSARRGDGQEILVACMPGELHDLGLLFFAVQALDRGLRVVNLGPNLPLEEISRVAAGDRFAAVVLAANYGVAEAAFDTELAEVCGQLSAPLFIGGRQAAQNRDRIEAAGAIFLGDRLHDGLSDLMRELREAAEG